MNGGMLYVIYRLITATYFWGKAWIWLVTKGGWSLYELMNSTVINNDAIAHSICLHVFSIETSSIFYFFYLMPEVLSQISLYVLVKKGLKKMIKYAAVLLNDNLS